MTRTISNNSRRISSSSKNRDYLRHLKLTAMTKTLLKKSSRGCIKSREASAKVLISTPRGWMQHG
jgi:hypothetical protein